jgi:hypothetical protein
VSTLKVFSATDLEWGWKSSEIQAPALWGARCYEEQDERVRTTPRGRRVSYVTSLAVLHDRQALLGEETERRHLLGLLNKNALDQFREKWDRDSAEWVITEKSTEERQHFSVTLGGVVFTGVITGGYVYVTAYSEGQHALMQAEREQAARDAVEGG